MTVVKINPKVLAKVAEALAPYADEMFADRSGRWMAVVEFEHDQRTEPGTAEDETGGEGNHKPAEVKLRITCLEVADGEHEHHIRSAQRALFQVRTADGTFDSVDPHAMDRANLDLRTAAGLITGTRGGGKADKVPAPAAAPAPESGDLTGWPDGENEREALHNAARMVVEMQAASPGLTANRLGITKAEAEAALDILGQLGITDPVRPGTSMRAVKLAPSEVGRAVEAVEVWLAGRDAPESEPADEPGAGHGPAFVEPDAEVPA